MSNSTKLKVAFVLTLIAVGVHLYLIDHYFNLTFGLDAGESICNVSSKINCDTVTASHFSALFGMPIALWGAVTNAVLSLLLFVWILGWSSNTTRLGRYTILLSGFTAAASIVMGSISSLVIGSYCLFCMSEYLMSFLIFGFLFSARTKDEKPWIKDVLELFGPAKKYLIYLAAIPLLTVFFNYCLVEHYGVNDLPQVIRESLSDWQGTPEVQLDEPAAFTVGTKNPKMVIAEFADFRCPHCRHAVSPVDAFVNSHADVEFKFYTFPLDGTCNDAMGAGDGISCYLAKSVYCAEKVAGRGSLVHHKIFENQEDYSSNPSLAYAKEHVSKMLGENNIKADEVNACVDSPDTDKAIRAEAKLGATSGVKGTPTFYINGRKLNRGQLIPVLEAVHTEIVK